jgi:hypothetical protein
MFFAKMSRRDPLCVLFAAPQFQPVLRAGIGYPSTIKSRRGRPPFHRSLRAAATSSATVTLRNIARSPNAQAASSCAPIQVCNGMPNAPSSIEQRANYLMTEKSIDLEGLSSPIAPWLVDNLLTISANRSLNQPSSKQFAMSTHACMLFFGQLPSIP